LKEFRPIGGAGNNLKNPELDVVPGTPEIALTPLNFVWRTAASTMSTYSWAAFPLQSAIFVRIVVRIAILVGTAGNVQLLPDRLGERICGS
jgi:hypothetical protein